MKFELEDWLVAVIVMAASLVLIAYVTRPTFPSFDKGAGQGRT